MHQDPEAIICESTDASIAMSTDESAAELTWVSRARAFLRAHWFLVFVIVLGVAVRTYRFGQIPPGFNQDEASMAYDGYSLLHYGVDRHGFRFPAMFLAWGGGPAHVLRGYLSIPFLWLFGPTVGAARVVTLIINIAAIPAFALLANKVRGERAAIIAACVLSLSPWHVVASRWAHEHSILAAMVLFGTYLLLKAKGRARHFYLACAVLALALYSYAPAIFFVPLYLALCTVALRWTRHITLRQAATGLIVFTVIAVPMGAFLLVNALDLPALHLPILSVPVLQGASRYGLSSTLLSDHPFAAVWVNFRQLWELLRVQEDGLPWNAVPGFGFLFPWLGVFAVAGILSLARAARTSVPSFLVLLWLLVGVAMSAILAPNINRMSVLVLVLIFAAALGVDVIARNRRVLAGLAVAHVVAFGFFAHAYFTSYPEIVGEAFFASFDQAVKAASENTSGPICVTTSNVNMPYIFVLYFEQIDPRLFRQTVVYEPTEGEFQGVRSFGRYVFSLDRCRGREFGAYVLDNNELSPWENDSFRIIPFERYSVAFPRSS